MNHQHSAETAVGVTGLAYCQCGAETRGRGWRDPKTWWGKEMRKAWRNRPVEA